MEQVCDMIERAVHARNLELTTTIELWLAFETPWLIISLEQTRHSMTFGISMYCFSNGLFAYVLVYVLLHLTFTILGHIFYSSLTGNTKVYYSFYYHKNINFCNTIHFYK